MNSKEAIDIIERLLVEHRRTHINWLEFLTRNPHREMEFKNSAGSRCDQKEAIASYDRALNAIEVLKEKDNG
jgi:hypothetical protein